FPDGIAEVVDQNVKGAKLGENVGHGALTIRVRGHFNSYGVSGNVRSLQVFHTAAGKAWLKWLRRRSNRTRLTVEGFHALLRRYPLPRPYIAVRIWGP
ncbi:MAG: hypothetical protein ACE5JD_03965, partial [Candidatus Methylomirabilia bacterium]